jgi:hypothetical protein
MSVEPREAPEGSVFRFTGRRWRPNRKVRVTFGAYCRPDEACIAIAYIVTLYADQRGRFVFRLRAGPAQPGDDAKRIRSGARPSFAQRVVIPGRRSRTVTRQPRYRVILPECDCG